MGDKPHSHSYTYAGVVYQVVTYPTPGTGARDVLYYDHYFCQQCLDHQYQKLVGRSTTYEPIRHNATPMPEGRHG